MEFTSAGWSDEIEGAAHGAVDHDGQFVHQPVGDLGGNAGGLGLQKLRVGHDFDRLLGRAHFQRHIERHGGARSHHDAC